MTAPDRRPGASGESLVAWWHRGPPRPAELLTALKRQISSRTGIMLVPLMGLLTGCATSGPMSLQVPSSLKNGQFTGQTIGTQYGDVQVQITVSNGQITDVQAPVLPSERSRSEEISLNAGPQLHDEVLQAVTAHTTTIDTVSGATYTSDGYVQSLQSAIDQAHP